jgi:isoleucyl-tRNA synthetase
MSTETPQSPPAEKKNYKTTLNLPQTVFPMEAKLVANEPARLKQWQDERLYEKMLTARAGQKKFILHDGPPFANGDIHIGHLINKTLKDVVLRYKTMRGFQTPYVPGWDCHGLPIEHKIQQDLGSKIRDMSVVDVRKRCHEYAQKYVDIQSQQFQRLGILGEWNDPYLTMKPTYEAATLEVFAKFVEAGLVYKQLKPVHWSIANQTALADAELEYKDKTDTSVFVEFPVANPGAFKSTFDLRLNAKVSFLIWTTTPWTLPANMAIAVNPEVEYAFVKYKQNEDWRLSIVASDLVERVFAKNAAASDVSVFKRVTGKELLGQEYSHPFVDRVGKILSADYVTTTDGTGLVHTAPGHGEEDYATGIANGIEVYCPVLANGRYDSTVPGWLTGITVWEGNPKVVEKLKELNVLFAEETISHSYPHDWRSKTPTIFRATEQWFVGLDRPCRTTGGPPVSSSENQNTGEPPVVREETLRERAQTAASSKIGFIPEWGQHRLSGMLQNRPDWCISRQRAWGLPIPVFYNDHDQPLLTPESVRAVAKRFAEKGSDAWFLEEPSELLGADFAYPPGFNKTNLRKEKDIFDVWFESGSSWHAVLQCRSYLQYPADLYLEGSDQHRGWFQLSLLPALGATGQPPFKQVLTHGFVVKPDGTKVSKSDKEYVTATQEINKHGADLLRLWCCSVDYQNDIPASPKALQEFGDKYRKIRNTLRYLLSNLYDFNPATNSVAVPASSLDGWAMAEVDKLIAEVTSAYDAYQTHRVFRLLHDFCSVQISSIYTNALKDRMYCESPNSPLRRRSQTVMFRTVIALTKMLAPMLVFTADETWEYIPHKPAGDRDNFSVHLALWPDTETKAPVATDEWDVLFQLRESALQQLDALKKSSGLNKASEAEAVYELPSGLRDKLAAYGVDLEDIVGAGYHSVVEGESPAVKLVDRRNDYPACARSWKRRPDVGSDPAYPELSARDAKAMAGR